jgi:hypothetical protein
MMTGSNPQPNSIGGQLSSNSLAVEAFTRRWSDMEMLRQSYAEGSARMADGSLVRHKLTYRWRDGESYPIIMARGRVTSFVLFPGEGFNTYALDDDRWFGLDVSIGAGTRDQPAAPFGPQTSVVPIKAFGAGKCTGLTIYTTWRIILADICSTGSAKGYNRIVEMWMPGAEVRQLKERMASGEASPPAMDPITGLPVDRIQGRYKVVSNAGPEWRADDWKTMHDGRRAYIVPPAGLSFIPVPVAQVGGQSNTPVHRTIPRQDGQGSYFVIEGAKGAPAEVVMQHGEKTLTLRRAG